MKAILLSSALLALMLYMSDGVSAIKKTSCTPGTTWKEDCHICKCDIDGVPDCTRELCKGQGLKIVLPPIKEKREINNKCVPGTSWEEDCNHCFCTANGDRACTRRLCNHETPVFS